MTQSTFLPVIMPNIHRLNKIFPDRLSNKPLLIWLLTIPHTHTQPFNGPFSRTTRVSRYQSGFYWSKRQWVAMASAGPYASLHLAPDRQPHQHPTTLFFTGRMPLLPPNQQCQSTEGIALKTIPPHIKYVTTAPCNLLLITTLVWHCQPFSDINVPQGSAAMPMRCGGIFNKCCAAHLVENLTVKFFLKIC